MPACRRRRARLAWAHHAGRLRRFARRMGEVLQLLRAHATPPTSRALCSYLVKAAPQRDEIVRHAPQLQRIPRTFQTGGDQYEHSTPTTERLTAGSAPSAWPTWPASRARRAPAHQDGRQRSPRRQAQHLRAAALLRSVSARKELRGGARHHRAHLRHLPGGLSDEFVPCPGEGAGCVRPGGRARLRRCATCSTAASGSRATCCTCSCCICPTSWVTKASSRPPPTIEILSPACLALKKAGNAIVSLLGGREVHPINVKVGGSIAFPPGSGRTRCWRCSKPAGFRRRCRPLCFHSGLPGFRAGLRMRRSAASRRISTQRRPTRLDVGAGHSHRQLP